MEKNWELTRNSNYTSQEMSGFHSQTDYALPYMEVGRSLNVQTPKAVHGKEQGISDSHDTFRAIACIWLHIYTAKKNSQLETVCTIHHAVTWCTTDMYIDRQS